MLNHNNRREIKIFLRAQILATIREMHRAAGGGGTLAHFVAEIAESAAAEFRCRKITTAAPMNQAAAVFIQPKKKLGHPFAISRESMTRLAKIKVRDVPLKELARRFGCGASTVRRAMDRAQKEVD